MNSKYAPLPDSKDDNLGMRRRLIELIECGAYEQTAEKLKEICEWAQKCDPENDELFRTIQRICQTCTDLHSKADYYHHEFESAKSAEDELRRQLFELLTPSEAALNPASIPRSDTTSSSDSPIATESSSSATPWERFQALLMFALTPPIRGLRRRKSPQVRRRTTFHRKKRSRLLHRKLRLVALDPFACCANNGW